MMKCWLEEWLDFLFPEPVEVDMDGDKQVDIPETPVDGDAYVETPDISGDIPEIYMRPELIPVKGDGLPAVAEAERVVRSRR